ncbi:tRNA lysidine(34) synthetase TilS [Paenibacillus sp. GCM10012303]|jgi:tRNA(Ile)-lysidine synthase|uniref:tRNA lysidine(34) synthetase TilS n=1 Tax=Paenibacillus sp. GCM10012303 TaxID=3317340 RepID=UPI00361074C0
MELLKQVDNAIRSDNLVEAGDRIVVAVSGGPDSMALLHVLFMLAKEREFELIAAHFNHGFRGEESDREADMVAGFAKRLGIACEVGSCDMPAYIAETGMNAQAAAREKRYSFLFETAAKVRAGTIALAHHADDQAETVLMRLLRGAGSSGLAGIPLRRSEKNLELIRPLLRIYKSELECHCAEYGLPVCRDSSNESRKYFRNQIRLDVLPFLRRYNDKLPESLNRLADTMRAEDEWMEAETQARFTELVTVERSGQRIGCSLESQRFIELPLALQRRLIKLILNYVFSEADLSDFARIETVRSAISRKRGESFTIDLHERLKLLRVYDTVRFVPSLPEFEPYVYAITAPDQALLLPEAGLVLECRLALAEQTETLAVQAGGGIGTGEAYFDVDRVTFPLSVRSRQAGDRIAPLGLKGTKKVKDMFIDAKIPPDVRRTVPHVLDATGQILWIPGVRRSAHAPVTEQTARVLVMKVRSAGG